MLTVGGQLAGYSYTPLHRRDQEARASVDKPASVVFVKSPAESFVEKALNVQAGRRLKVDQGIDK